MSKVEARLDRVECTFRVSGAPETRAGDTTIVVPERVQWKAWLPLDGRRLSCRSGHAAAIFAEVAVFGLDAGGKQNCVVFRGTFGHPYEPVPSWIPVPPAWYAVAVAELRAVAEDLSRERVAR